MPSRVWHRASTQGKGSSLLWGGPLISNNDLVAAPRAGQVSRAGARRGARRRRGFPTAPLLLGLGAVLSVVAWGFLVWAAIDFGRTARGGQGEAWWFLALASVGAVACLFLGLMLVTVLLRRIGLIAGKQPHKH